MFRELSIKVFGRKDMCKGAKAAEGKLGPKYEVILTLRQRTFALLLEAMEHH